MTDTIESLSQQLAESQLKADANARGFSDVNKKLAECQAREKVRIDALRSRPDYPCADKEYGDWCAIAFKAEYLPSDSTALDEAIKQAKREVLLEAEGKFWCYDNVNDVQSELRRMAEELK
jgi:hypothetical protein